jgi:hypothetical protein
MEKSKGLGRKVVGRMYVVKGMGSCREFKKYWISFRIFKKWQHKLSSRHKSGGGCCAYNPEKVPKGCKKETDVSRV